MGIKGKFEVEYEINCNGDILHEIFSSRPHNLCEMSPLNVHSCELHEGEFGKVGSVLDWSYTLDGQQQVGKELIEEIDEENKLVRFKLIEGDILNEFVSLTSIVQTIPKGESLSGIRLTFEFEKIHDDGHYPTKLIDAMIKITKDIEAQHQPTSI
ncbi:MLP-like protein 43 [Bienertia sinuspersici]